MVKLRKEELNALVGKTIYHYYLKNSLDYCFAKDTKINVSQLEVFKVYEEDSSCETSRQYIYIKGCKICQVDVKDIGNPSVVAEDWYSFERNDELARKIFKAYENEMYIRRCASLINSLSDLKSNHNLAEYLIQKREIDDSRCEKIWNTNQIGLQTEVDDHAKYLQGIDLSIMINSIQRQKFQKCILEW